MFPRLQFAAALVSALLLGGCSLVGKPEPPCRPLEVTEFPLLGGMRGTWMDDERFVLADLHQSRLLVYSVSEGLDEVATLGDHLYLKAGRLSDSRITLQPLYAEFGPDHRPDQPPGAVRKRATWLAPASAEMYWNTPGRRLAATGGSDPSVFALRFSESPFVQQLAPGDRRLESFPELPAALPTLPIGVGYEGLTAFYSALEAGSYPAGLYADQDSLYILMRNRSGDDTVWDLYRLDPQNDEIVSKVRLPTTAVHVSLLPGSRYWLLEESTSGLVDMFRPPIRLLLIDAAAIRAGEVSSCD